MCVLEFFVKLSPTASGQKKLIKQIWTIGHSTRPIEVFIAALEANGIKLVADVRMLPGSRRHPQFNQEALIDSLGKADIRYEHFPELGGRGSRSRIRATRHGETMLFAVTPITWRQGNSEWNRASADSRAEDRPTAIMCAEAVWWRCHRSLISDFLKVRELRGHPHP